MIDITWQPAYIIKAYPELRGFFSRGENHLLAYLHNWAVQLTKKGKPDPEWIFLTQQQIAEAIDYSVSSVKRFIAQINQKITGAVEVRSKQVYLTKFFTYTVWEYRVNWQQVTDFLALSTTNTDLLKTAETAQSSHLHFKLGVVQAELGVVQDELTYKDQFKDQINKKTSTPTLFRLHSVCKAELCTLLEGEPKKQQIRDATSVEFSLTEQDYSTSQLVEPTIPATQIIHNCESISPAPKKMSNLTSSQAASMGLICQNNSDGSQSWVNNPAGRSGVRSAWIEQGMALGLWSTRDMAFDFQSMMITYGRNQDWCRSPLDYANSVIKGLICGDNPKADRFWEAWRNELPIGWENLFDWEVQPGVINPAFANWVSTQLFDSTKLPAANAAEVAKQLRFNSRQLWARFQREVGREVAEINKHRDRGQTYLPPGAMLPRADQPTAVETRAGLNCLMQAAESALLPQASQTLPQALPVALPLASDSQPEMTIEEFAVVKPDILARMQSIGGNKPSRQPKNRQELIASDQEPIIDVVVNHLLGAGLTKPCELVEMDSIQILPQLPDRPLAIRLLPEIVNHRKLLETQWRRKSHRYDLAKVAKYQIWADKGDAVMQAEAIEWLKVNYVSN